MYANKHPYESFFASLPPHTAPSVISTDLEDHKEINYSTQPIVVTAGVRSKQRVPWSSGLCDCLSDRRTCCRTFWCPCVTFGQIAEIVDKGSSSCGVNGALYTLISCVTCCCCWYSCFYRAKMRQQHSLKEDPCRDCLVHLCCECCALCQEYRELTTRGYDLSIGWHGNMEKKNRKLEMAEITAPMVEEGMNR
ncbi:hypothetical protein HS088_TW03G00463 [Tripterygium wilfordii]|uniref:Protein PLANT CADMIUM RESISTANCE 2-like n=1 Tax=Tripterygium wilfordii TaxID=458696 RepID=A0A7J7DV12_TRIWF|nr:protein PLANT CADMIUM RESISTANCE 2-like [Tripterygium wilfordii]KAF5750131.1 hypothetical protein HS088_TW03G00463 [Tripterygium wilfordii]